MCLINFQLPPIGRRFGQLPRRMMGWMIMPERTSAPWVRVLLFIMYFYGSLNISDPIFEKYEWVPHIFCTNDLLSGLSNE